MFYLRYFYEILDFQMFQIIREWRILKKIFL